MATTKEPDFFETLAGHEKGHPVAEQIRESLLAEAEAVKQAENTKSEKSSDYEQARMDTIKKQLLEAGVFKQTAKTDNNLLSRFFDQFKSYFIDQNWGASFAVAASILVVSAILLQKPSELDNPTDYDAIRGSASLTIKTDNPALTVQNLKEALANAGAEVIDAQINDNEWTLEIDVPDKSKIEAVKSLLAKSGVKVKGEPSYQVSVRK